MAKKYIISDTPPKFDEPFSSLTKGVIGVPDGTPITTSPVVGICIITGWVKTKNGSTYYFQRYNKDSHKFLGESEFCALCGVSKSEHK